MGITWATILLGNEGKIRVKTFTYWRLRWEFLIDGFQCSEKPKYPNYKIIYFYTKDFLVSVTTVMTISAWDE